MITNIVGQEKLLRDIEKHSLVTWPHSVILQGEVGSGKHLICNYILSKFNIETPIWVNETTDIKALVEDDVNHGYLRFYIFEGDTLSEKNQNALLKFIEEPPETAYIIFLCNSMSKLLTTIQNRCIIYYMNRYSKEELGKFTSDPFLLELCETPGQVIEYSKHNVQSLLSELNQILEKMANFPLSLIFQLSGKIGFTEKEVKKLPYKYFAKLLLYASNQQLRRNPTARNFEVFKLTTNFYKDCFLVCDKKRLYEKYLVELKELGV